MVFLYFYNQYAYQKYHNLIIYIITEIQSPKIMRFKDKLVVGFVWGLIAFQGFSFLYLFASNLYIQNNFLFVLYIPLFIVVVSILCVSYYRATLSNPGTPNYLTNINYGEQIDQIKISARKQSQQKKQRRLKKKKGQIDLREIQLLNTISYCFKCDVVKEKRVHHCSVCKKCIIRMDHHCPWTGNCVGRYNHKYFILFLFYATTGLLMVSIAITIDYLTGSFYSNLLQSQGMRFWLLINCITSYMLATSIGFLFITQMITGCQNITTLESFTQGIKQRNPWNHESSIQNLRQIFGYSNWLLPTDPFPDIPKNQSSSFQLVSL